MANQTINLNYTPQNFQPCLYYSQGDVGRMFQINLQGIDVPSGATVTLRATKPSGFGFNITADSVADNVATFTTVETMTNEHGRFPAEVHISSGSVEVGSANFLMVGEKNPHPDTTIDGDAEEVIPQLTLLVERVETAASKVLDMEVDAQTLPAGSAATYSYNEEENKVTFGIPEGQAGSGAAGTVASAYSATKTYAVGDYAIQNGNLYRCTTAITTAESFTAAHWTQVVLGDEVTQLKSEITHLQDYSTKAESIDFSTAKTVSGYIAETNTYVYSGSSYRIARLKEAFVVITGGSINTHISFLKSNPASLPISFCDGESRRSVKANTTYILAIPDDCKYIFVTKEVSGTNYTPASMRLEQHPTGSNVNAEWLFDQGTIQGSDGKDTNNASYYSSYIRTYGFIKRKTYIEVPSASYEFGVFQYAFDGTYIGRLNTTGAFTPSSTGTQKLVNNFVTDDEHYYRIAVHKLSGTVSIGNASEFTMITYDDSIESNFENINEQASDSSEAIKNVVEDLYSMVLVDTPQFEHGTMTSATGEKTTPAISNDVMKNYIRTSSFVSSNHFVTSESGYPFRVFRYELDGTYAGRLITDRTFSTDSDATTLTVNWYVLDGDYKYVIVLDRTNAEITDANKIKFYKCRTKQLDGRSYPNINPRYFFEAFPQESIPVGESALDYDTFMDTTWEALRAEYSDLITRNVLTQDSTDTFPIYEYVITPHYYDHTVLITAGMHGNEYEGFWSLYRIIKFILSDGYKYEKTRNLAHNIRYIIIPVLNPYGVEHRTRENGNGINAHNNYDVQWDNPNMDHSGSEPFECKEALAVKLALQAHSGIELYVELHTDPYQPSYGNYTEVIVGSSLIPTAYNITLDERHKLAEEYGFVEPLSQSFVIYPTYQSNSIRYLEEIWHIPAILLEASIKRFSLSGSETQMTIDFEWYINCIIEAIKTL